MNDDDQLDQLLLERVRSWVDHEPPAPSLDGMLAHVSGRTRRRRWTVAAAGVVVAAAVAVGAYAISAREVPAANLTPASSPTLTSPPSGLTAEQRTLAISAAQQAAESAIPPAGSSIVPSGASEPSGWPSNVDKATAIAATRADAMHYLGAITTSSGAALVVRLVGDFSAITTGPPGSHGSDGNVLTLVVALPSGLVTDSNIRQQPTPEDLPDATVLYIR